jgi:hypothetical protein
MSAFGELVREETRLALRPANERSIEVRAEQNPHVMAAVVPSLPASAVKILDTSEKTLTAGTGSGIAEPASREPRYPKTP